MKSVRVYVIDMFWLVMCVYVIMWCIWIKMCGKLVHFHQNQSISRISASFPFGYEWNLYSNDRDIFRYEFIIIFSSILKCDKMSKSLNDIRRIVWNWCQWFCHRLIYIHSRVEPDNYHSPVQDRIFFMYKVQLNKRNVFFHARVLLGWSRDILSLSFCLIKTTVQKNVIEE